MYLPFSDVTAGGCIIHIQYNINNWLNKSTDCQIWTSWKPCDYTESVGVRNICYITTKQEKAIIGWGLIEKKYVLYNLFVWVLESQKAAGIDGGKHSADCGEAHLHPPPHEKCILLSPAASPCGGKVKREEFLPQQSHASDGRIELVCIIGRWRIRIWITLLIKWNYSTCTDKELALAELVPPWINNVWRNTRNIRWHIPYGAGTKQTLSSRGQTQRCCVCDMLHYCLQHLSTVYLHTFECISK